MDSERPAVAALVVGHVTHDRVGDRLLAGGGAYYGARVLAGLGVATRLVTAASDIAREGLDGVIVENQPANVTTTFVNRYGEAGERTQWIEAVAPRLVASGRSSGASKPDILFLAPVIGEIEPADWTGSISARVVGLGLQGLLRRASGGRSGIPGRKAVVSTPLDIEDSALDGIDVVFLSDEDVEPSGLESFVERLRSAVRMVALTHGERGSTLYLPDRAVRIGLAPARVVDPTGAGDTYAAAFLFGLSQGYSPESAGCLAAAAASIAVEGEGGSTLGRIAEAFERVRFVRIG